MLLFDDLHLIYTKHILRIPFIHLSSEILSTKDNCVHHKSMIVAIPSRRVLNWSAQLLRKKYKKKKGNLSLSLSGQ